MDLPAAVTHPGYQHPEHSTHGHWYSLGFRDLASPASLPLYYQLSKSLDRYRTTSSFERYNDGRKLWSQIVLATRTFARTTWFHVPGILFFPIPLSI